jgi:hypothetical protein
MQLAIAIDPAAFRPSLAEKLNLTSILPNSFAQRVIQPSVETAGPDA